MSATYIEKGYRRLVAWAYIQEGIDRLERYANGEA